MDTPLLAAGCFITDPDVIDLPTSNNFFSQIIHLAKDKYFIDLFIFAHGSYKGFKLQDQKVSISTTERKRFKEETGLESAPIRIVYQMNCYGYYLMDGFQKFGAKAVCGARYVNFYPNTYNGFARRWNEGDVSFSDAIRKSNRKSGKQNMNHSS